MWTATNNSGYYLWGSTMADIIDKANDTADFLLSASLRNRQLGATVAPAVGIGMCLHCKSPITDNRRWCDADCRNGWELDAKRKAAD